MSDEMPRPANDDGRDAWKPYWQAQGMPWRTEPEVDAERQHFLAKRRGAKADIERGIYPFRDEDGSIKLTRADVEWLLATLESHGMRGPVDWSDEKQRARGGVDLRGADLRGVNLAGLPLARLRGGLTDDDADVGAIDLAEAAAMRLERANLTGAHLESALLRQGHLKGADLRGAHLTRANLYSADFSGARLGQATLAGANLRRVVFNPTTNLYNAVLSDPEFGEPRVRDIQWNGVDLTVLDWTQAQQLGDERVIRRPHRRTKYNDYPNAVRANRQLATVLRSQGLNEQADRFAFRAQVLQRRVYRRERRLLRYLGSLLLDLMAGYGYRPLRSIAAYLLVVGTFALVYLALGGAHGQSLSWNEAVVVSLTGFYGRGFFATAFQPGDPQAAVAAIEAVFGLLIEITFIATFTQRFFAR